MDKGASFFLWYQHICLVRLEYMFLEVDYENRISR